MKRPAVLTCGALAAAALTATPAGAAAPRVTPAPAIGLLPTSAPPSVVDAGTTTLTLDDGVRRALGAAGIAVAPVAPATAPGTGVAFSIQAGRLDPDTGAGRLVHTGGLKLARGPRTVRLTDLGVTLGRGTSSVDARVNGRFRLPVLRLVTQRAVVQTTATSTSIASVAVHVTKLGATVLNRALHTRVFRAKARIGAVQVTAQRSQISFAGGDTTLALDPAAAGALSALGISVTPSDPAFAKPDGSVAFPITGGAVRTADLKGLIRHSGGLTFASEEGAALTLRDPVVDTARGVLTAATEDGSRLDLLALDLSAPTVMVMGDAVTVGGVGASLTAAASAALAEAFGVDALAPGLRLGAASVNGQAR